MIKKVAYREIKDVKYMGDKIDFFQFSCAK